MIIYHILSQVQAEFKRFDEKFGFLSFLGLLFQKQGKLPRSGHGLPQQRRTVLSRQGHRRKAKKFFALLFVLYKK